MSEPLDLKAIGATLRRTGRLDSYDVKALIAALREHRAALRGLGVEHAHVLHSHLKDHDCHGCQAARALAGVRDD